MVSIIIPVYNAECFLKKCIDSVRNQSYRDIEIIIIDDGSTDHSRSICEAYQRKDNRIHVIHQENAGQGEARNKGIRAASGDYIMFVDSDDWVDECIVEKLMDSLSSHHADIAVCNIYRTLPDQEETAIIYEESFCDICLNKQWDKNYVFNISSYPIGKLYKTSLFRNINFTFPRHFFEDVAAIPILFAYAEKISFMGEALYYYRNNSGSTTNDFNKLDDRIRALYSLVDIFKQHHLFDQYYSEMESYIYRRLKVNYRMAKRVCNSYCDKFMNAQNDFYEMYFRNGKGIKKFKVITWGSYNLYTVSKILMNSDPDEILQEYYGFQSIISLMNKSNQNMNFFTAASRIPFRRMGIINDFTNKFLHKSSMEFSDADAVLIDFLEERYDVGVIDENHFTLSDAFLETQSAKLMKYEILPRFDENTTRLWKESCDRFVELLTQYVSPKKLVLVRMKLCEYYGDSHKKWIAYPEIEKIRKVNKLLDEYYDYFMFKCPEAVEIDPLSVQEHYYTSQTFRHGCFPWHINQTTYSKISELIYQKF